MAAMYCRYDRNERLNQNLTDGQKHDMHPLVSVRYDTLITCLILNLRKNGPILYCENRWEKDN